MMLRAEDVSRDLQSMADPVKAAILQRFFKTGPGQYGEGDVFLGLIVPKSRHVAKKFSHLPLEEIPTLLYSRVHEERFVALLILIQKYDRSSSQSEKDEIVKFYLDNIRQVNNWDLVDLSAPSILGAHLMKGARQVLYRLAKSSSVWERRAAIVSTYHFIKNGEFEETLRIAEILLQDDQDLIHKAVGWMLREVGKRNAVLEEAFVDKHYRMMPRTMLRYAIERFPQEKKSPYMKS
jgi:3-methyladenine DNA glycosylase AlkD